MVSAGDWAPGLPTTEGCTANTRACQWQYAICSSVLGGVDTET